MLGFDQSLDRERDPSGSESTTWTDYSDLTSSFSSTPSTPSLQRNESLEWKEN